MNEAKIRLSAKEMELITNADWILTKNEALLKIERVLANLQLQQKEHLTGIASELPTAFVNSSPKISKGENYQGLPYRLLDYPKIFNQSEILAVRTMFWWGNFFSITLHLSGSYKTLFEKKIITAQQLLGKHDFHCCINEKEWEHHFAETNFIPVKSINEDDFQNIIRQKTFIKLAYKLNLQHLAIAVEKLMKQYKVLIELLTDQAPRR